MAGAITDKQLSNPRHESGHRCRSHDSTFVVIRTRGIKSSGGHEFHTQPADAAAGDTPTVTRHAMEKR